MEVSTLSALTLPGNWTLVLSTAPGKPSSFALGIHAASRMAPITRQALRLTGLGLLEWAGDHLRLTPKGHLLGNQVFLEFIS